MLKSPLRTSRTSRVLFSGHRLRHITSNGTGHGSRNLHRLPAPTASQIAERVQTDGYAVIRGLFSNKQMQSLNCDLDEALSRISPGKPAAMVEGSTIPSDAAVQAAIFGSSTKRIDKLIKYSKTWRALADDEFMHQICTRIFQATGDYWLSTAQMIELGPGSGAGPLHPDAGLWWLLLGLNDSTAPELAVNFLVAATKTTIRNGATGVVEGSHKLHMSETLLDQDAAVWKTPDTEVKQIELEAGDCLLVGGRIFHRSGANRTANEARRVLSIMVTSGALTPEEAHPHYIDTGTSERLGERAKAFFGYKSLRPTIGAGFWRT